MMISAQDQVDSTYQACLAALTRGGAHAAANDVIASDAARLGDVPAVIQGVIKELKHE